MQGHLPERYRHGSETNSKIQYYEKDKNQFFNCRILDGMGGRDGNSCIAVVSFKASCHGSTKFNPDIDTRWYRRGVHLYVHISKLACSDRAVCRKMDRRLISWTILLQDPTRRTVAPSWVRKIKARNVIQVLTAILFL